MNNIENEIKEYEKKMNLFKFEFTENGEHYGERRDKHIRYSISKKLGYKKILSWYEINKERAENAKIELALNLNLNPSSDWKTIMDKYDEILKSDEIIF